VNGDTINIPSGSCTWTNGITVPSNIGITIIGSGAPNSGAGSTGAGTINTTLTSNASGYLFTMSPTYGNSTARISTLKLTWGTSRTALIEVIGTCTSNGCPNLRMDNLNIPTAGACNVSDASATIISNMFGVADHNTIGDVASSCNGVDFINVAHGSWQGVGFWGDNSWATADTFGTAQQFYLENNTLNFAFGTDADTYGTSYGGARFTCRFNTFNSVTSASACTNHGTDTIGRTRGGRQIEFYDNTGTCPSTWCNTIVGSRSGAMIVFGNVFTGLGGGETNGIVSVDTKRRWDLDSPWGPCDGTSTWDQNDSGNPYYSASIGSVGGSQASGYWTITDSGSPGWTTNKWAPGSNGQPYSFHNITLNNGFELGSNTSNTLTTATNGGGSGNAGPSAGNTYSIDRAFVCMDQPARGASLLVEGGDGTASTSGHLTPILVSTGNPGSVANALDPIYEFNDSAPVAHYIFASDSASLIANRDYYVGNQSQTAQTSSSSPFTGNPSTGPSVGWGTLANRPTACTPNVGYWATDQGAWNQSGGGGQGQLYQCSATNTWSVYYTPYTYPHPLTTATALAPPTNVQPTMH
jgi:hypothetical protein